jgi:hypothetical protein
MQLTTSPSLATGLNVVKCLTKTYDLGSNYSTTSWRYTAPSAGYYLVTGQLQFNNGSGAFVGVSVSNNGTAVSDGDYGSSTGICVTISDVIQMAAGDYLQLLAYCASATQLLAGTQDNYWSVMRVA